VEIPKKRSKWDGKNYVADIIVCVLRRRTIVERQKRACYDENQEEQKSQSAQTPGVRNSQGAFGNLRGMNVKKKVVQNCANSGLLINRVRVTENRLNKSRFFYSLKYAFWAVHKSS
jgi:hypothetical protein